MKKLICPECGEEDLFESINIGKLVCSNGHEFKNEEYNIIEPLDRIIVSEINEDNSISSYSRLPNDSEMISKINEIIEYINKGKEYEPKTNDSKNKV